MQNLRGSIADAFRIGTNARERWIAHHTNRIVIIDPDHSKIVRNREVDGSTSIKHLLTTNIVANEQSRRPRERTDPFSHLPQVE